jgi:hypothetical protein
VDQHVDVAGATAHRLRDGLCPVLGADIGHYRPDRLMQVGHRLKRFSAAACDDDGRGALFGECQRRGPAEPSAATRDNGVSVCEWQICHVHPLPRCHRSLRK